MLSLVRCTALIVLALSTVVDASGGTLETIHQTRTLNVGIREGARPFSYFGEQGKPEGYTVDFCNRVINAIRKEARIPDLKVNFVPVNAVNRVEKIKSGAVDFECGQTVNTKSRQEDVDFSYAIFISGEQFMSRAGSGLTNLNSLDGKMVATIKGSTAEKLFARLHDTGMANVRLVSYASNEEALKALESGKVSAFAQLDVTLESLRAQAPDPSRFVVSKESLSVEPNCIMLRRDDAELKKLINNVVRSLLASSEFNAMYDKWFKSGGLNISASHMLRDSVSRPSDEPAFALILGNAL
jgi:glutamate/aspartate transport system substrate-binding protein